MKIGAFEVCEPVPDLREPQAFAMLSPWIDVGGVGRSCLSLLEAHFHAGELGRLRRPGYFYDFTRYRPIVYWIQGHREIRIPNTIVNYAAPEQGNGLLFFHCLEPHMLGETFVDSILKLLVRLKVSRYCLIGGMYDSVPHTRPLIVTGNSSQSALETQLREANVNPSGYQGPTTIHILLSDEAPKHGIETLTLIVHLPNYAPFSEDYSGQYTLLSLLCRLYNFSIDLVDLQQKGEQQYAILNRTVEKSPEVAAMVRAMEINYDAGAARRKRPEPTPPLSPEIERFLKEIDKGFATGS